MIYLFIVTSVIIGLAVLVVFAAVIDAAWHGDPDAQVGLFSLSVAAVLIGFIASAVQVFG